MEKICPIMSRPFNSTCAGGEIVTEVHWVDCQKEKCGLWATVEDRNNSWIGGCALLLNLTDIQKVKIE